MSFRQATVADTFLLYCWRLQAEDANPQSRLPISTAAHRIWLDERLDNPLVQLLIWEHDGSPTGTVRIDSNGELAFHADTDKTAVEMLRAAHGYAAEYGGRLKATLDLADRKVELLERAGFTEYPAKALIYKP